MSLWLCIFYKVTALVNEIVWNLGLQNNMVVEGECVACESPDETKLAMISQLVSLGDRWVHKG